MNRYIRFIFPLVIFLSCENSKKPSEQKKEEVILDYTNLTVLDSLVKTTKQANESLFLDFKIGMSKSEFKKQITELKKSGKKITYSASNTFTSFVGDIKLGEGYTFTTNIASGDYGKAITGVGKYFLETIYNSNQKLMQLNILPIEKWDSELGVVKPNWLKENIIKSSSELNDDNLHKALIDLKFLENSHFIRRKGQTIIYEGNFTITYIDFRTLLVEMMIKIKENELKRKESKGIKF